MTLQEETQKLLNVIEIIKKLLILGLTVAFLILTIIILTNFFAYETTYRVSSKKNDLTIPSMTVCYTSANDKGLDKFALANGAMKEVKSGQLPLPVSFHFETQTMDLEEKSFDLTNQTALMEFFKTSYDQMWTFTCKALQRVGSDSCLPCITLNIPNISTRLTFGVVCKISF